MKEEKSSFPDPEAGRTRGISVWIIAKRGRATEYASSAFVGSLGESFSWDIPEASLRDKETS